MQKIILGLIALFSLNAQALAAETAIDNALQHKDQITTLIYENTSKIDASKRLDIAGVTLTAPDTAPLKAIRVELHASPSETLVRFIDSAEVPKVLEGIKQLIALAKKMPAKYTEYQFETQGGVSLGLFFNKEEHNVATWFLAVNGVKAYMSESQFSQLLPALSKAF